MELISRISKGTRMDQIYIPKKRSNFSIGSYVVIKPVHAEQAAEKPYFYNIKSIEPVKIELVNRIFGIIDEIDDNYENVIITGSFLDNGFNFNDIDIILISEDKLDKPYIEKNIENAIRIKIHIILLNNRSLIKGLETDPLYKMMLSRCIAKKRFIYKVKTKIDYKILDLHLLKSKLLIHNFDYLNGNEKYYLVRNMAAILLYLKNKRINKESIDKEIKTIFNLKNIEEIKQNMLNKGRFLRKYKIIYKNIFDRIMKGVEYGAKQKQTD